jgi:hypothetical protein
LKNLKKVEKSQKTSKKWKNLKKSPVFPVAPGRAAYRAVRRAVRRVKKKAAELPSRQGVVHKVQLLGDSARACDWKDSDWGDVAPPTHPARPPTTTSTHPPRPPPHPPHNLPSQSHLSFPPLIGFADCSLDVLSTLHNAAPFILFKVIKDNNRRRLSTLHNAAPFILFKVIKDKNSAARADSCIYIYIYKL